MIFESSLKGLVTDARLPYPCREVRIVAHHHDASQGPPAACGRRIAIPTHPLTPSPGRIPIWPKTTVEFNTRERGISFRDVQQGSPSVLDSAHAQVFPAVSQDRAELRIVWPGYGHIVSTFHVPTSVAGLPITRWEFARKVVECYASFWERARRAKISRGNERWDIKGFDFDSLVLTAVHNADGYDAIFQVAVETVVFR
ncbi:hypothetical protein LXA43DRAFT_1091165 [Ganoderma leucocontextum]|nr:hypothetical protein LXA43DRAFT_1091165 [Ganoderma leucocontextum]